MPTAATSHALLLRLDAGTSIPFHVITEHHKGGVSQLQLFSSDSLIEQLLGCPRVAASPTSTSLRQLRQRLLASSNTAAAASYTAAAAAAATAGSNLSTRAITATHGEITATHGISQHGAASDEHLSFAQALRCLERCTRLTPETGCTVHRQKGCDDAFVRFAAAVDFLQGITDPAARTCVTRSTRRPGADAADAADLTAWEATRELFRGSSHQLRGIKAHILDALEYLARPAFADLLLASGARGGIRPSRMSLVDVGAGGGLIDQYLLEKYGLEIRAYDVVAPKDNIFAYETQQRVPVRLFNGSHLPLEADRSADAVLFNAVLHHAAHHTMPLLAEAERISRRWILLVEDVTVRGERNPREKHIHIRHKQHGKAPFKGAPKAIFRPQHEWVRLLQASGAFTVTRVGAVVARNLSHEFRLQHTLANHWNPYEYVGPTYQRYFVAERCV